MTPRIAIPRRVSNSGMTGRISLFPRPDALRHSGIFIGSSNLPAASSGATKTCRGLCTIAQSPGRIRRLRNACSFLRVQ